MKRLMLVSVRMAALGQRGCAFLGGAAVEAVGTSTAYEINAHSKMNQLEDDYKAERTEYPAENTTAASHRSRRVPSSIKKDRAGALRRVE
jgi:hypothetical protein